MITLLQQPYACSYSKNEISFDVTSNQCFTSVAVLPSITLTPLVLPEKGAHYRLIFTNPETGKIQEVRVVAAPLYSGPDEIPDDTTGVSLSAFVAILYSKIKEQYGANGWFTVEKIGTTAVKLTVNTYEAISPEVGTNQTSNWIDIDVDSTLIDPEIRDGYQIRALVYFEDEYLSGNFRKVANVEGVMGDDARYWLDVSHILNAEIEATWEEFPLPKKETEWYLADNLRRYYVDFVETWQDETSNFNTCSEVLHVHWGGISTDDEFIADPLVLQSTANNFLTWWPSGKMISEQQEDWLSWMNTLIPGAYKVYVTIYTTAGNTTQLLQSIDMEVWQTLVFRTGYTENDLQGLVPGQEIRKWEFYIRNSANKLVSNKYMYYLYPDTCIKRTILFFNSHGMPETFTTSGEWMEAMVVNPEIATRSASFNLNRLRPRSFIFASTHKNTVKAVTSTLTKMEAYRLKPLINSMISFVQDGNRWRPIIMISNSVDVMSDNEFVRRVELEIMEANDSDRASYHVIQPDIRIVETCGITRFEVIDNGMIFSSFGNLLVQQNGSTLQNLVWDAMEEAYIPTAIVEPGEYSLTVQLDSYYVNRHFTYRRKRITFFTRDIGFKQFYMRGTAVNANVYVDWGVGEGWVPENYLDVNTNVLMNFVPIGKKRVVMEKACFDDVLEFGAANMEISDIDFSPMTNLEVISFVDSISGNLYLSQFTQLRTITLNQNQVYSVKLGFQKNLQNLSLFDLAFDTVAVDDLFLELWKYRQFYLNQLPGTPPGVYISGLGFTESALVTSIINGTGEYVGQGLVTDYGWTVVIL